MTKKINMIIPMAGKGSRFAEQGYVMPKQLIMVDNKQTIDWNLSSIKDLEQYNLIFIIRQEHVNNFALDEILKQKFGSEIKIIILEKITRGSTETCLLAKDLIENKSLPLIINTLDVYFEPQFNFDSIPDSSDGVILTFKSTSKTCSYVKLENGKVIQTAEKENISENAAVGIYYFKSGEMFFNYAEKMIADDLRTNNEFYICPIYNLLIQDGLTVTTQPVDKMHLMGTPEELEFFISHSLKRFGNKPIALCSDHSGFKLKEIAKDILELNGLNYIDFGPFVDKDCDYDDYVSQAVKHVQRGECDHIMGFCRTGQGVNIAANKKKGIRGTIIFDEYTAEYAIRHNCSNFFSCPSKYIDYNMLDEMIKILKVTTFDGGRHADRIQKIERDENIQYKKI